MSVGSNGKLLETQ